MYELKITKTAKPMGSNTGNGVGYEIYDHENLTFNKLENLKSYLKDTYGNCKTFKIHRDTESGQPELVGKGYSFKSPPCSYGDKWHFENHWTEVLFYNPKTVLI